MKKKFLVMVLAVGMVMSGSVAAFAETVESTDVKDAPEQTVAEISADGEEGAAGPVMSDAVIAAYDAYVAYEEAVAAKDMDALKEANRLLEAARESLSSMDGEGEFLALGELLGVGTETLDDFYSQTMTTISEFIELTEAYDAYTDEVSIETCEAFIQESQSDFVALSELAELFYAFYEKDLDAERETAIDTVNGLYDEAFTKAMQVESAYHKLQSVLMYGGDGVIRQVMDAFPATIELLDTMTDDELEELAGYLGVDTGKEAYDLVHGEWMSVQAYVEFAALYSAYVEDANEETAAALIDCYEKIESEYVKELLNIKYENLEEITDEAYHYLEAAKSDASASDTESAPATGDETTMMPMISLFTALAAVLALRKVRA